mmetsp:Transcript_6268/g.10396  ORF Transcript_6268/g.10396 Transcript_6268/m.10396 type:complete len:150 (-) Transcript_6268:931-1380(-)
MSLVFYSRIRCIAESSATVCPCLLTEGYASCVQASSYSVSLCCVEASMYGFAGFMLGQMGDICFHSPITEESISSHHPLGTSRLRDQGRFFKRVSQTVVLFPIRWALEVVVELVVHLCSVERELRGVHHVNTPLQQGVGLITRAFHESP